MKRTDDLSASPATEDYAPREYSVVAAGMSIEMGRIAGMLKSAPQEVTPLEKQLDRIGKLLGLIVVGIAVVMIATIIVAEHVTGYSAIFEVLILGGALAAAAVPEGLPAIVTAVLGYQVTTEIGNTGVGGLLCTPESPENRN